MAKDPYADDIARLSTAKRIHFTHFMVPKLPWHTDDHKFGQPSDPEQGGDSDGGSLDGDEGSPNTPGTRWSRMARQPRVIQDSEVGETCSLCLNRAVYEQGDLLFCAECFEPNEDPYR